MNDVGSMTGDIPYRVYDSIHVISLNRMSDTKSHGLSPATMAAASALFIFFWGSGFIAAKFGLPFAEPFTFMSLRFVGVAMVNR